ncbi:acriflavine sensitivity control protein acr-2 [Beauveria bassiana ARSEF 2860]|uniref:Acriflavine sensitivity control protein acr-2 n=3 Tax=Beauveria TaxID=5581 RepID=J4KPY9_BEAB2|nr:acriflavine sensitivity control protein acr-2 [Beauveria bassiana ARSEF 2860]EJP68284.1 acriflavine sensitivity control protein acr-2 [Beauveria bassiana ARSEF 2860]
MNQAGSPTKPCHNCRRQRLRCDRSYPHCNKCINAGKECLGYGKLFRWTGAVASRGKLAGRTSSAPVPAGSTVMTASSVSFASPVDSPKQADYTPDISSPETQSSPSTPPPDASPEQMQLVSSRTISLESELKTPYILIDPLYQDLGESHRYYLSYFTNRVCKDLVSHDVPSENPFRSLLPLTKAHPLLQYIIVAASAAHMSNLMKAPLPTMKENRMIASSRHDASQQALQHALVAKHKALLLMRDAVENIDVIGGDVALAAALFFVNVELIESGKHGWKAHLEGAGRIMSLLEPSASTDNTLRNYMLSDCFIYFILGSAFMPMKFQTQSFEASRIPAILDRAAANSYLCCPPAILQILHGASQLSNLQDQDEAALPAEIEAVGLALLQQARSFDIVAWANDARIVSYLHGIPIESRIHAGSAHRLAACLYILQAVPAVGAALGPEFSQSLSRELYEHLASIPDHDPNFKATTWPTFIVGAEETDDEQRQWVMDRLQRLVVNCPWGFLYTAMETLPVIWGLDKETDSRSWLQALKDPDMNFLLV